MAKYSENLTSVQIGMAGDYRIASELILRGLTPARPAVDCPIDWIIVENGKRLQVKTSLKPHDTGDYGTGYNFSLRVTKLRKKAKLLYQGERKPFAYEDIDFVICWCVDDGDFYVIPVELVKGQSRIHIAYGVDEKKRKRKGKHWCHSKFSEYKEAWHLLAE